MHILSLAKSMPKLQKMRKIHVPNKMSCAQTQYCPKRFRQKIKKGSSY